MAQSGCGTIVFALAAIFLIYQCSSDRSSSRQDTAEVAEEADPEVDEDRLTELAEEKVSGSTYTDLNGSHGCTQDCSGHDAGFEWARDNDITDAAECGGTSSSFIEGCEAYAERSPQTLGRIRDARCPLAGSRGRRP